MPVILHIILTHAKYKHKNCTHNQTWQIKQQVVRNYICISTSQLFERLIDHLYIHESKHNINCILFMSQEQFRQGLVSRSALGMLSI